MELSNSSFIIIYIFLGFAAVALVFGILFIRGGYDDSSTKEKIVPISDPRELKELKADFEPSSINIVKNEAVLPEPAKQNLPPERLENPQQETSALKNKLAEWENKYTQLEQEKRLSDEALSQLKAEQENRIEVLIGESEQLKKELVSTQEMLQTKQSEIDNLKLLKTENNTTAEQLQKSEIEVRTLQTQIKTIAGMEQKLESAHATIDSLESELRKLNQAKKEIAGQQLADIQKLNEQLKNDCDQAIKSKTDLELAYQKLKSLNENLIEKEKILRYELTKNRAQVLSFEKICEDLKKQLASSHQNSIKF